MGKIYIGAAYYPEMWKPEEVDKDIERCKSLGINTLRIGEFAWGKMEPKEGKFDFSWLISVTDKLYAAGINTVMCTPTCTPPRWLLNKYEETRMVMHDLVRAGVSSRCHTCKTSPIMRQKNKIIVTEMAKIFGKHPGVIGWQLDNEIFPYADGCYCPLCKQAFRNYLKQKYGTAENLNRSWGMARWSLEYASFDEIEPPYPKQWKHPSLYTEWKNFQCGQIYTYLNEQAEVLHNYTDAPVGTDMMAHNLLSYYKTNEKLDVVQFNHYDTAENLPRTAFSYDFLRPIKSRPFWVTETQVGWNGSEYAENGFRPENNCYVNTWLPIAKGAEMNLYWLFRTHPNGHELAHGALYSTSGRAYRVSNEVARAVKDIDKCNDFLCGTSVRSKIAIHYSSTAAQNFSSAPMLKGFDYRSAVLDKFYAAFKHYNIDIIDTQHSLNEYDTVISPFLTTVDEYGLPARLIEWINAGGTWIVGPMSDIMTDYTSKFTESPFPFLEQLVGVYAKYQLPIASDNISAKWKADGAECKISDCYDAFELRGAESLIDYDGVGLNKLSVVAQKKIGAGKIIILGSVLLHKDLLRLAGKKPIAEAGSNIVLVERSGTQNGIIAIETENKPGFIVLFGKYFEEISGERCYGRVELNPYDVKVFIKE